MLASQFVALSRSMHCASRSIIKPTVKLTETLYNLQCNSYQNGHIFTRKFSSHLLRLPLTSYNVHKPFNAVGTNSCLYSPYNMNCNYQANFQLDSKRGYVRRVTKKKGHSYNLHRSNRAKNGLYHGRDVRSGHSISFSGKRHKRKWHPNVQKKRLWSETLDTWVRFNITVGCMKIVDYYGGIDNYVLALDEKSVADSNYITKMRRIIAASRYLQGTLNEKLTKRLGFDKVEPTAEDAIYRPQPKLISKHKKITDGPYKQFYKGGEDRLRG